MATMPKIDALVILSPADNKFSMIRDFSNDMLKSMKSICGKYDRLFGAGHRVALLHRRREGGLSIAGYSKATPEVQGNIIEMNESNDKGE